MRNTFLKAVAVAAALLPVVGFAQSKPTSATYITDEEIKAVNALPGVDRTIRVVDIGPENYAVGVIHRVAAGARGATPAAAAPAARGGAGGAGAAGGRGGAPQGEPCGEQTTSPPTGATAGMIAHDQQTEGYSDHLRQRHAGHRREDRQRPPLRSRQRSHQGAERAVVQRTRGRR